MNFINCLNQYERGCMNKHCTIIELLRHFISTKQESITELDSSLFFMINTDESTGTIFLYDSKRNIIGSYTTYISDCPYMLENEIYCTPSRGYTLQKPTLGSKVKLVQYQRVQVDNCTEESLFQLSTLYDNRTCSLIKIAKELNEYDSFIMTLYVPEEELPTSEVLIELYNKVSTVPYFTAGN